MGTKRAKKALLEVISPRICITFRRASFWFRPKTLNMWIWKDSARKHNNYLPCQQAMTTFLKKSKIMNIGRNCTHMRRIGLRIKPFESARCYQSNGTPPDPQNCHRKFKIDQQIPRSNRPNCPLNLAINRSSKAACVLAPERCSRSLRKTECSSPVAQSAPWLHEALKHLPIIDDIIVKK